MILGSLIPDINPLTQPHRDQNLLIRIFNNHMAIQNSNSQIIKSIRSGIMFHYICDYFCYAHNYNLDISHGKRHMQYEIELHRLLKDYMPTKKRKITLTKYNFMQFIIDCKKTYDLQPSHINKDLFYCVGVLENSLAYIISNFKLKEALA